ncbi:MAG: urate hydroxylase PuuD [Candidatus Sericytochromatia bacterium]|nr:urate hydroxylase PuuD [Candidatus Tanganyikabacteria bacterium]
MSASLLEFLNLLIRWIHVVAGIMWVGASLFFVWMENNLKRVPDADAHAEEVRMVHGGGYWHVQKRLFEAGQVPGDLQWFKWEAYTTWISGAALLVVVYYLTGGLLTDPAVAKLTHMQGVGIGIASLVLGWLLYDGLWRSPLGRNPYLAAAASYVLLVGAAFALTRLLSGRAAFIHVGAMLGTMMAANVAMHIIPNQRRVIAAIEKGEAHDVARSEAARMRSRANNYMTLPVVFIMVSNHYSLLYGSAHNWLVLGILVLAGAAVNHFLNLREREPSWDRAWIPASLGTTLAAFTAVYFLTAPPAAPASAGSASFRDARAIVDRHCLSCHSRRPTDDVFKSPPLGITFDDPERIRALAARIKARAVVDRTMPLGNKTGMTERERATLAAWIDRGARAE